MIKWCFSTLGCTDKSLTEVISLSKKYGISAIEVRGLDGELDNEKISFFAPENALNTRKTFENAGVLPLILGTSASFHDCNAFEKNLAEGKKAIEIASLIGFFAIRVFGNLIVGEERECINRVARGIRELCLFAEDKGVSVFLEVHGDFNIVERLLPIAEYCRDREEFGIIWDICHTHDTYGDAWKSFYDALSPYIRHVHIKDVKNGKQVLPGDGELEIVEVVKRLTNSGYTGYFSLEWEKYWRRELPEIEKALEKLFSLFDKTTYF